MTSKREMLPPAAAEVEAVVVEVVEVEEEQRWLLETRHWSLKVHGSQRAVEESGSQTGQQKAHHPCFLATPQRSRQTYKDDIAFCSSRTHTHTLTRKCEGKTRDMESEAF